MNFIPYVISFLGLSAALTEALFLFKGKSEPILFCIKVCPLYCRSRSKRDVAQPASTDHYYFDADEVPWPHAEEDVDWPGVMPEAYYTPYFFCKPHPTTTPKPTEMPSTKEPSFICQLCKDKCKYPK